MKEFELSDTFLMNICKNWVKITYAKREHASELWRPNKRFQPTRSASVASLPPLRVRLNPTVSV